MESIRIQIAELERLLRLSPDTLVELQGAIYIRQKKLIKELNKKL